MQVFMAVPKCAGGKQTWRTYGAFPAQVAKQALVLLRGQKQRAHVSSPAGRWVAVHGVQMTRNEPQNDVEDRLWLNQIHAGSGHGGLQPDHLRWLSPAPCGGAAPSRRMGGRGAFPEVSPD